MQTETQLFQEYIRRSEMIPKEVVELIPDIGEWNIPTRRATRALRDKVLAQLDGIHWMEDNCLLNGRQQMLVMATAVFDLASSYHAKQLSREDERLLEELASEMGIRLGDLAD